MPPKRKQATQGGSVRKPPPLTCSNELKEGSLTVSVRLPKSGVNVDDEEETENDVGEEEMEEEEELITLFVLITVLVVI